MTKEKTIAKAMKISLQMRKLSENVQELVKVMKKLNKSVEELSKILEEV